MGNDKAINTVKDDKGTFSGFFIRPFGTSEVESQDLQLLPGTIIGAQMIIRTPNFIRGTQSTIKLEDFAS